MKGKLLGFTEEVTDCGCCGKGDLKGTYAFENSGDGSINYYGSVCASRVYQTTTKELKLSLKVAESESIQKAKAEYQSTPEYQAYEKQMIDREPILKHAEKDTYFSIVGESMRLSSIANEIKLAICKKHLVKRTYLV